MTRLHPYTLLAVAASLAACAWSLPPPAGAAGAALVAAGLLLATPHPGRRLVAVLATAAPFWVFLFLLHGPARGAVVGARITALVADAAWLLAVLAPGRLIEALVARGWAPTTAFVLGATLSTPPLLQARARTLVEAQRCRGLSPRGGPAARLRALRALALPLVLSALHEVEERALALETRGLGAAARRTPLDPPADSTPQRAARWGLLVLGLGLLALRLR